MKIAVATEDGNSISAHFGRSPYFAIYDVQDGEIANKEMRENIFTGHFRRAGRGHRTHRHGHGAGDTDAHRSVWEGLRDCSVVISHGMGRKAWEDLRARDIEMIVTDETDVEQAVRLYLAGEMKDRIEERGCTGTEGENRT
jgi:predicted Fe-Mo cluster-binding NifX family protein